MKSLDLSLDTQGYIPVALLGAKPYNGVKYIFVWGQQAVTATLAKARKGLD